jgi:hypothetical protein
MGRTLGSSGPGGGAAGEGEEHGVGGAHHGVASDGKLEFPKQVSPEALAAHADTSRDRDGRAAAVALAARGGSRARDREPAHTLFQSIIHGAPGGGAVGPAAGAAANGGGGGGGHGECARSS